MHYESFIMHRSSDMWSHVIKYDTMTYDPMTYYVMTYDVVTCDIQHHNIRHLDIQHRDIWCCDLWRHDIWHHGIYHHDIWCHDIWRLDIWHHDIWCHWRNIHHSPNQKVKMSKCQKAPYWLHDTWTASNCRGKVSNTFLILRTFLQQIVPTSLIS